MLNKRRQELIIQNLKSISSQVRLMSVDQLLNLPAMPPAEKIKCLEGCLQDSDDSVRNAAKNAIAKLGGNSPSSTAFSNLEPLTPKPMVAQPVDSSADISTAESSKNVLDAVSEVLAGLPDLENEATVSAKNPVVPVKPAMPAKPVMPVKPVVPATPVVPQMSTVTPAPKASLEQPKTEIAMPVTNGLIDGPVDASLPPVNGQTDIAFLVQHIKSISATKPAGYLTRLFELCKSMHEEVALTALQTLLTLKDKRVPPHILGLLDVPEYSSQRRFLMLKIIMDSEVSLSEELLENILVKEKDVIVKSGLVKVFARNCGENGIPLLIKCLHDDDPRVRANTVEVIEAQRIKGCEQEIIKLLNDSENRVKVNAAKYLVKIGYQQAFYTLRSMLVSPEVWLRDSVIFALGEIGDQPSLVLLRAALKDPNQGIRLSVLKALAKMNNATSRQILKAACGDPDPIVAQIANSLFDKIKDTPVNPIAAQAAPYVASHAAVKPAQPVPATGNVATSVIPAKPVPAPAAVAPIMPAKPTAPVMPASPVAAVSTPVAPSVMPAVPKASVAAPAAMPKFSNPKAASAYAKLCSASVDEQRIGIKETIFITGEDHLVLLGKAMTLADISIRIATVKLLSRNNTPQGKDMLLKLSNDSNETVASLAKKTLMILK